MANYKKLKGGKSCQCIYKIFKVYSRGTSGSFWFVFNFTVFVKIFAIYDEQILLKKYWIHRLQNLRLKLVTSNILKYSFNGRIYHISVVMKQEIGCKLHGRKC